MAKSTGAGAPSDRQEEAARASAELRQGVSKARAYAAEVKSRLGSRSFQSEGSDAAVEDFSSTSRARAYAARNSEQDR